MEAELWTTGRMIWLDEEDCYEERNTRRDGGSDFNQSGAARDGRDYFLSNPLIALIFLGPDLALSWHTISEWAIGRYAWIMSGAFLISGLSYAALFVMLRSQLHGILGRLGLGILLICSTGAAGAGIFTTDPMPLHPPLSTRGTLHVVFGTSQLVLLPFAALLINLSLARNNETWRPARRLLLWTAGVPLFGFLSFAVYSAIFVFPLGPSAYGHGVNIGWPPRFAFFTYALWVVSLGLQAIGLSRRPSS